MHFPLIPDFLFESIYTIDIQRLRARGVKLLLADLDNTLVPYSIKVPTDEVKAWRDKLKEAGITLFILSNSRKPGRAQRFAEALGVPYQGHAGKPKSKGFYQAMERMGVKPQETAIVGDQIFTDIWGGNNAGVTTLMVKPIEFGTIFRVLRYGIETPFRTRGKGGDTL
ncbi:YqeG family HAD IIIA-type phosphatase [Evtepia sp.]|uniref:YqeG family HAD IIIA-type phosphatase n=1 Tax=Evtepia sp. TaxID=2773933 RepID=UPI003F142D1C